MANDVMLNKVDIIERCIKRIDDVYDNSSENLKDFTKQDSIILNIQRICEASIDLAMHIIAEKRLGIPQSSRDAFDLLQQEGVIGNRIAEKMKMMVGFRNIAVHNYQAINLEIIKNIVNHDMNDIKEFVKLILKIT